MIHCNHCQLKIKCYKGSVKECDKYNAIADRPSQLYALIRKALNNRNYKEVEKLQKELFYFNHGNK